MNGINTKETAAGENRVKTNGQVFTPDSIVNEMLDLTDRELALYYTNTDNVNNVSDDDYISYIVLEPTAGNGNFIIRELERKLIRVQKYTGKEQEIALLKAVSSIHGIELSADNVIMTKLRMMEVIEKGDTDIFELEYKDKQAFKLNGFTLSDNMRKSIKYILDRNIQCGDSLKCEKYLINKAVSVNDEWSLSLDRAIFFSSILTTELSHTTELVLTQYDFDNGKVALRERTYNNMHSSDELYQNTSVYVDYDKVYTIAPVEIFISADNDEDEDDFDF